MNVNPLVSVSVITYNSGNYILETLESIKNQTYENIELVISDDCSTDNTVELCKEWVAFNKSRFVDTVIIVSDHNTGIPANCNRAIKASKGVWYKEIAGDDLLMPECIEKNINFVADIEDAQIVFSKMYSFIKLKDGSIKETPFGNVKSEDIVTFNQKTAREQYIDFLNDNAKGAGGAPTVFAKRELYIKNPFNEKYKGFEDVPQWINLSKKGVHAYSMDEYTVKYRRGESLTSSKERFYSPLLWTCKHQFFWNELKDMLIEEGLYDTYNRKKKELLRIELLDCLTHNRITFFNKVIYFIISKLLRYVNFTKWN